MSVTTWTWVSAGVVALVVAGETPATALDGNAERGKVIYHACEDCHSIDENDVGPLHRGVVGRRAGTVPGYDYSRELKTSGIIWTEDKLDTWLKGPTALVPGTKMGFQLEDAQQRADVIAYLKTFAKVGP